jgi:hypothetical protein
MGIARVMSSPAEPPSGGAGSSSTSEGRAIGAPAIAASTIAVGLPRADALTDALLAVANPHETLAPAVRSARRRLEDGLAGVVAGAGPGHGAPAPSAPPSLLRIGHYQVARAGDGTLALARSGEGGRDEPGSSFRWTSRSARRPIGLAALRAGLDGRAATPADAVATVIADPSGPLGVGRAGPGSAADWIESLAPPARAVVACEATAWATRLWTAVDWGRLPPHRLVVGGPDRWWRWSGPSATWRVALRGRADVRVGMEPARDGLGGAHLVVLDGTPGAATRQALLLSALVDALSARREQEPAPVPPRVIGWWPECGKSWIVVVDARTLLAAADAVVETVRALLGADTPGGWGRPR